MPIGETVIFNLRRSEMDKEIVLTRWASTPEGVYGFLDIGGYRCYTVERPWKDNEPSISCIPAGTYKVKRGGYNKGGYDCIDLIDVPGRTYIKIHKANVPSDIMGCIGVGTRMGWYKNQWSVASSKDAFTEIMRLFSDEYESIRIKWQLNPELL